MAVAITAHAFWTIFQIKSSARRKKLRRAGFQVPGHADAQLSVDFRRDGKR